MNSTEGYENARYVLWTNGLIGEAAIEKLASLISTRSPNGPNGADEGRAAFLLHAVLTGYMPCCLACRAIPYPAQCKPTMSCCQYGIDHHEHAGIPLRDGETEVV